MLVAREQMFVGAWAGRWRVRRCRKIASRRSATFRSWSGCGRARGVARPRRDSAHLCVYAVSFLVCTVWWIFHHALFHGTASRSRAAWANAFLRLWIAFMPLPTALRGRYPTHAAAAALYGVVCALAGLAFWHVRRYATKYCLRSEVWGWVICLYGLSGVVEPHRFQPWRHH